MKKLLPNLLVIAGFCLGTVGAAGFHSPAKSATGAALAAEGAALDEQPTTESRAWPFLLGGLALLVAGGVASRRSGGVSLAEEHHAGIAEVRGRFEEVRAAVGQLESTDLDDRALLAAIDELRSGVLFELGSQSDDFARRIGQDAYAAIWSPFATCERLLNRCWSMTADGFGAEAREELPYARSAIESATSEAGRLLG